MYKKILFYGVVAGLIVGVPLLAMMVVNADKPHQGGVTGMVIGYTTMLIAFATIFIAIRQERDQVRGGIIKFWPAFGLGLGIAAIASFFWVGAWEAALAITGMDFAADYAKAILAKEAAAGASPEQLAKLSSEMEAFKRDYAQPLYRMVMSYSEIFPIGLLVSAISAGLLSNPAFLPSKMREAARSPTVEPASADTES